jgi:methyl-galactoside transport system substrate-binding protein
MSVLMKQSAYNQHAHFIMKREDFLMRLLKKVLAVGLASAMVFSMAGCGGSGAKGTTAASEATTAADTKKDESTAETTAKAVKDAVGGDLAGKKVGISIYKFDDNFMTLYRTELQRYLTEDLGFKKENVVIQDGKGDQAEQTNQIQNFITQKYDVLILNLVQASSAPEITDMCKAAGIPVVYINREPDTEEEQRWKDEKINATYVGCDARQSGTYQGEEILETSNKGDINGDGVINYIMIQGDPENVDAQYRTEFSVKALTESGAKVKELLKQRGDWDQAKAQQIAQDALTQYGDQIEVIFCNNDAMALGALQAIEAAGRTVNKDIYLVGVDALTEAVQNVIDGKQTGTVFNDHFSQAKTASDMAAKLLQGETVENVNMVDYIKITKENAQDTLDKLKK